MLLKDKKMKEMTSDLLRKVEKCTHNNCEAKIDWITQTLDN